MRPGATWGLLFLGRNHPPAGHTWAIELEDDRTSGNGKREFEIDLEAIDRLNHVRLHFMALESFLFLLSLLYFCQYGRRP